MSHRLLFASTAFLLLTAINAGPVATPLSAQTISHSGTVKAIQAGESIDLITGMGYAVRTIRMGVNPQTQMMLRGAAMRLSDFAPGDIVRIDCHMTEQGEVADRIEKLRP